MRGKKSEEKKVRERAKREKNEKKRGKRKYFSDFRNVWVKTLRINFSNMSKTIQVFLTRGERSEATLDERPNLDLGMSIFFGPISW